MLQPIQLLLTTLAQYARSRNQDNIAEYLELAAVTAAAAGDDKEKFAALTAEIQAMVALGRDPTEDERSIVRKRREELSAQIRALGKEV